MSTAACDAAWPDALKHLQNGALVRWLNAYKQTTLLAQLQHAQTRHPGDPDAILELFLRPNPIQGLDVDRTVIDFGVCTPNTTPRFIVTLRRRHPGYIHGTVNAEAPWLQLSAAAIRLRPSEASATIGIAGDVTQLITNDAQRSYTSAVVISTNYGSLRLPVQIMVSNPPHVRLQPPEIHLGRAESLRRASGSVAIINEGGGVVTGTVRAEQSWLTVEAQHARFSLGYYQHATVNFGVTTEQLTPQGTHRGALIWETDQGGFETLIQIEVTPLYAVEPGNPDTAIKQKVDLVRLCDCEPQRGINNWQRGCTWLRDGRITAALRFLGETELAEYAEECAQLPDVNIALERTLRALGARPARSFKDNSGEVVRQIMGMLSRRPPIVEYAILNTSRRGYLHGYVQPLVNWLNIPEPHFGCLPGEEAVVKLYPDYKQRKYGDLFAPVVE